MLSEQLPFILINRLLRKIAFYLSENDFVGLIINGK